LGWRYIYISFSGGKDSTVLLDIVRKIYPEVEAVFIDTGLEYPEIRDFVKTFDNVTWLKPEMNFKQVIEKYGYPVISKEVALKVRESRSKPDGYASQSFDENSPKNIKGKRRYSLVKYRYLLDAPFKISNKCCDIMKKNPVKKYEKESGKKAIIGMLAEESCLRQSNWLKNGCNAFNSKRPTSNPLSFWTEQDILQYILQNDLKIADCYGEIVKVDKRFRLIEHADNVDKLTTTKCKRTGCMFCMFGAHLEQEPNRFQMMKETHPKQYDYCINKLGLGKVLDFIKVDY
jgi:3'-phosphoadenosine 5'-phosphosulfate sulfotransferase (PAPS reductase)/FAD synthetase